MVHTLKARPTHCIVNPGRDILQTTRGLVREDTDTDPNI